MKAVLLAGGFRDKTVRKTSDIPKTMVMIGNKPIIWHIMKFLSCYNIRNLLFAVVIKKKSSMIILTIIF